MSGDAYTPKTPHEGDYEPPEVDDWRPGDHRPGEWVPTNAQAESILADMRVDRLVEIVRDGLGQEPRPLPSDAPIYMRRDNVRLIKAHIALTELANRAYGVPDA